MITPVTTKVAIAANRAMDLILLSYFWVVTVLFVCFGPGALTIVAGAALTATAGVLNMFNPVAKTKPQPNTLATLWPWPGISESAPKIKNDPE